jgi:hypothetical protein
VQTFPAIGDEGVLRGFEIKHAYLTARSLSALVSEIDGVVDVANPGKAERDQGVRLRFKFKDLDFEVWEPYADSSRYLVGPSKSALPRAMEAIRAVEGAFQSHQPRLFLRIVGSVLSLDLRTLLGSR